MPKIIWKDTEYVPELFLRALQNDYHPVAGDISVSELLSPPQARELKRTAEVIEESAPSRLWALVGTAIHSIMEKSIIGDHEERQALLESAEVMDKMYNSTKLDLYRKVSLFLKDEAKKITIANNERFILEETVSTLIDGVRLYGTYDVRDLVNKGIEDYKYTKAWAYIHSENKDEWKWQLNTYRWILSREGVNVDEEVTYLKIWGMFRDFNRQQLARSGYPKHEIMPINIPILPLDIVEQFVKERISLHKMSDKECTGKDRWADGDKWKIYVPTSKTAIATLFSKEEAEQRIIREKLKNHKAEMKYVPGENKRCEHFCPVASICPQWKKIKELKKQNQE